MLRDGRRRQFKAPGDFTRRQGAGCQHFDNALAGGVSKGCESGHMLLFAYQLN
jgi:hypothetical protein